jgi:hypothetical protein
MPLKHFEATHLKLGLVDVSRLVLLQDVEGLPHAIGDVVE